MCARLPFNNVGYMSDILIWCSWLMFAGDPVEGLTKLIETRQLVNSVCGAMWRSSGEPTRICFTLCHSIFSMYVNKLLFEISL
jgi:hypothetical protein